MKHIQKRLRNWLVTTPLVVLSLLGVQLFLTPALTHAAPVCTPSDTSGCTSSNCSSSGGTWGNPFPGTTHPDACTFTCSSDNVQGCDQTNCPQSGGMWENPYGDSVHPDTCVFSDSTNQGVKLSPPSSPPDVGVPYTADAAASGGNCKDIQHCDLFVKYINPGINLLAAAVGIIVAISIIIGGLQYGSSAGDPQKASAAKNRIRNSIIALVAFLFLYSMLNFLIPGGLLN